MKKQELMIYLCNGAILFIATALIPNLLIYSLQISVNVAILAAIVAAVAWLILVLAKSNWNLRNQKKRVEEIIKGQHKDLKVYAISSRYWCDQVQTHQLHVERCTILIRKYVDGLCDKEIYEKEVENAVALWKKMCADGYIHELRIYQYDHIPDHYYCILDDSVLIVGVNDFSEKDSTGQHGCRKPYWLFAEDSDQNIEQIKYYKQHFENYLKQYKEQKIVEI